MDDYNPAMLFPKWYRHWLVRLSSSYLFWFCLLLALAARIWLVIYTRGIINGDEAQVGLQARHILQGARPVYFYGQAYPGSLAAYLIAGLFAITGPSVWTLRAEPALLSPLLVWLTWRLAAALAYGARLPTHEARRFMLTSALLAALPPLFDAVVEMRIENSYSETFALILLLLLSTLRLTQRWQAGASTGELARRWSGIGFVAGLGLWVNPLIICAIMTCAAWTATYGVSRWQSTHNKEQTTPGEQKPDKGQNVGAPLAGALPTSAIPTSVLPNATLPTPATPVSALPTSALPTTILPTSAIPTSAPPNTTPPTAALPASILPNSALPASAIPASTHTLRIAFVRTQQLAPAHNRQPPPVHTLHSPLAHVQEQPVVRTLQSSLIDAWRSPFARTLRSSLSHISRLDRTFSVAFVSIPAALAGFAPAFYWGAAHGWENITYIFRAGSSALTEPGVALHYPNRLAIIQGLVHLYGTCAAPHAISGALPGDPRMTFDSFQALLLASHSVATAPYILALGIGIVSIATTTLLLVRSYTQQHPLLLTARRLAGLPLLFGALTAVLFCVASSATSGLLYTCGVDKVGHYAAVLVLVLPLIIGAALTIARMSLPPRSPAARAHATKRQALFAGAARVLLLCGLFVYLAGQGATYMQSNPERIIQTPGCNAMLERSDQLVTYLERSHIHYAWATGWIGNVVMFESNERVVTADPRVITAHDADPLPTYTAAVSHATRASVLAFALSSDLHPTLLQTLKANHVTYHLARFSVAPTFDVLVVTPLNRTLSPFEGNALGAWTLGC